MAVFDDGVADGVGVGGGEGCDVAVEDVGVIWHVYDEGCLFVSKNCDV